MRSFFPFTIKIYHVYTVYSLSSKCITVIFYNFLHKTLNYKLLIQEYCEYHKIPLLQCNAFESQSSELFSKSFFKPDSTLFDEIKNEGDDIWQDEFVGKMKTQGKEKKYVNALHPNTKGYKIIADKLYNYINDLYTRI